ncbi:hypothetical protein Q31a_34670 [Aureliella helgolandensis]|uniref:Uncharacterized protein n=1 Tax=Aureliella helgolandensis TaxID=2527968 RepID=A0A518G967_9BACT|nr:hypothetical protein Q31a_34670 [Aureliella helgolandensis]
MSFQFIEVLHVVKVQIQQLPIMIARRHQNGGLAAPLEIMLIPGVQGNWSRLALRRNRDRRSKACQAEKKIDSQRHSQT